MRNLKTSVILMVMGGVLLFECQLVYAQVVQARYTDLKSKRPNIIFILTDDMGWGDLGALYQNKRKKANDRSEPWHSTPHLDALAAEGALLTNHYSAAPLCAPSRASLLSGLSQGHANVRDHQTDKALADNHTLGTVHKKIGYSTATIGKWGLQGKEASAPDWPGDPLNRGFDYFLGYISHFDGHHHYPKEDGATVWKKDKNITPSLDKSYTADLWTAAAKKWIIDHEKNQQNDQPFFLYLAYDTPHAKLQLPTQPYPPGGGLNGGVQWTNQEGAMINTAAGKVDSWVHPEYADATYDDDNDPSTAEVSWPDVYKRYATSIRRIDSGIGDIMQLLRDLNIDENTMVVFSSDNGPSRESYLDESFKPNKPTFFDSFGPFDGIKRDTWEGGVRVPTIAYWKGHIPKGQVIDLPSNQYDWLPTFMDANGVPAPANADGVSLLPSLAGKGKQQKPLVYIEYFQEGGTFTNTPAYEEFAPEHRGRRRGQMQNIRMDNYVGVRYNVQSASDDFEIYNVSKDPGQRNNLAENPERPPLIEELQQQMKDTVLAVRMSSKSASRPYDKALIPEIEKEQINAGLHWKAYDGTFPWVPKVNLLLPAVTGHSKRPDASVRVHDNEVLYFNGYLRVPKDGEYTFSLRTDTHALLRLHEAIVIDADFGYISGTERSGTIRLGAGLHPFHLYYMRGEEGEPALHIDWSGPGISKESVPDDVFFHDAAPGGLGP